MDEPGRALTGWADVDLAAISGNAAVARQVSATDVMAVVKADGYGHGAVRVARAARDGGARWLGVARAEEALELRAAGIAAPVLVLGHTPPESLAELIAAGVSLTVWSPEQVDAVARAAVRVLAQAGPAGSAQRATAGVHVKVDTGMNRIGVAPAGTLDLARRLVGRDGVRFEGVFTHFACADEPDRPVTDRQQARFDVVLGELDAAGLRPPLVHAANSAATLTRPGAAYDLVRFGIALYGLSPGSAVPLPAGIRPALTWKTVLAQVKTVPAGEGISYGHTYLTDHDQRIGSVPVGYADGWRRTAYRAGVGNEVLIRGRRVPVVGRVCMDQCLIDLDAVPDATVGDEVVLIGAQTAPGGELEQITADDVADRWGTIGYEVVCGIGKRVPRRYPS